MGADVRNDRGRHLLSAISVEGIDSSRVTGLGHTDTVLMWFSGSALGAANASAGASGIFALQHSFDGFQGWTDIAIVTASAGQQGTALYNVGPMGFLRANVIELHSAAQTGTGVLWMFARPGMR